MSAQADISTKSSPATKPSLTLKRRIKAAPEKVFAAWTDPEKLAKWFGPGAGPVGHADLDLRVGGRYAICFFTEDGEEHNVGGEYREVIPGKKLAFTWAWRSTPERESFVTVRVDPDGDGAVLTLTHEQFFDEEARDRHNAGWTACLDQLEIYLA